MLETLVEWDKALFEVINGQWHNGFLDTVMPYWRSKRFWIPVYLLISLFIGFKYRWNSIYIFISLALLILASDQLSSHLIKPSIERLRPCNDPTLTDVRILVHCGNGFSFTSSHATNHFALSSFLFLAIQEFRNKLGSFILFFWAATIAYGQVYVGVHFLFDVLAGTTLGCLIGYLIYQLIFKRLDQRFTIIKN